MQVSPQSRRLLSRLAELPEADRDAVLLVTLLLARASKRVKSHANQMLSQLITECSDSCSARSRLDEIIRYLQNYDTVPPR